MICRVAAGIARVAAYVASGFPRATNMCDGKKPCGPSIDVMARDLQITRQSGPHGEKRADPSEERFDEDDAGPTFPTLATYRGFRIQRSFRRRSEVQFTAATL